MSCIYRIYNKTGTPRHGRMIEGLVREHFNHNNIIMTDAILPYANFGLSPSNEKHPPNSQGPISADGAMVFQHKGQDSII